MGSREPKIQAGALVAKPMKPLQDEMEYTNSGIYKVGGT